MRATVLAVLAALLVTACGAASSPTPAATQSAAASQAAAATAAPEPAVTITFWHGQSGVLGDRLNDLITKFNATHKVQVQATLQGNYTQLNQKIVSAIQAGSVPDLAQVTGPPDTAQYWKAKALTPVQQFVDWPDGFTKDQLADFVPALLDDASIPVNGKKTLVSWPFSKSVDVLYYNPDVLKAAGVSVPKTWDEFRTALQTIKAKTSVAPLVWTPSAYEFFAPMLWAEGGDILSSDLSKAAFNGPEGQKALQFEADLVSTDKTAQVTQGYDWENLFAAGKGAFTISTSVSRPYIEQAMPKGQTFTVGMAPLPAGSKGPATSLFGNNLVIFSKAPADHQRGAWIFMKWLTEVDQTVWWSLQSGYMPLRQSATTQTDFKAASDKDPRVLVALNSLKFAHGSPASADWNKMLPVFTDMVTSVALGKSNAKDALATAEKKVNDILAGY